MIKTIIILALVAMLMPLSVFPLEAVPMTTPAPPSAEDSADSPYGSLERNEVTDRLLEFFRLWAANNQTGMMDYCAPSWQEAQENPKVSLFGLLANRTPKNLTMESIQDAMEEGKCTVVVTSMMDRNNGMGPLLYRYWMRMVKEDGAWYVDPDCLKTWELAETEDLTGVPEPTDGVRNED